ncbi:hypothetical protein BDV12DRAFT_191257 [Aspergillus spectabilis]
MESYTLLALYIAFLLALLLYLLIHRLFPHLRLHSHSPRTNPHPTVHKYTFASDCRTIIQASEIPSGPRNRLTHYQSRALENQELKRVFGIQNAFTTGDEVLARAFVKRAHNRLRLSRKDWVDLGHVLRGVVWELLEELSTSTDLCDEDRVEGEGTVRVKMTPLMQALALKISLWAVFNMRRPVSNSALISLGSRIHKTWLDMKTGRPVSDFKDNKDFHEHLYAVFPYQDYNIHNSATNPLNWILPSFETMWRIALRTFIELKSRKEYSYGAVLIAFARKPTHAQFEQMYADPTVDDNDEDERSVSADYLVKEALRLYPPTRRIRRTFHFPTPTTTTTSTSTSDTSRPTFPTKKTLISLTATADIECCHLSHQVWGGDATEFNPARWKKLTPVQGLSFLAFGSRPMLCPAAREFGPRVVGLIVGVLMDELRGWEVVDMDRDKHGGEVVGSGGERLRNDRGAYADLEIVRGIE